MPQTVEIPGQGTAEFPDEMSQDDIAGVIHKQFFADQKPPREEEIKPPTLADLPYRILDKVSRGADAFFEPGQATSQPLVSPEVATVAAGTVGKASGAREIAATMGPKYQGAEAGVEQSLAENISGFTQPEGLASLAAFAMPGVAELFALSTAAKLPEQIGRISESIQKHGLVSKETAKVGTDAALQDLMAIVGLKAGAEVRKTFGEAATSAPLTEAVMRRELAGPPPPHADAAEGAQFQNLTDTPAPIEAAAQPVAPATEAATGKIMFHGGPEISGDFKIPAFFTDSAYGAKWFQDNRGQGGKVGAYHVEAKNPLNIDSREGAAKLIEIAKAAGVDIRNGYKGGELKPEDILDQSKPWDFHSPDIAKHSAYDGTNFADLAYIPEVQAALKAAGYDSLELSDTLENTSIPTTIVFDPAQIKPVPKKPAAGGTTAPESAAPAAAIRAAVDRMDFEEGHGGIYDLANELEGIDNLPKPLQDALAAYREAVKSDREEFGQRSDLPETAGDTLEAEARKFQSPDAVTTPTTVKAAASVDLSPIAAAKTEKELFSVGGRMMAEAKTDADLQAIQSAMKQWKPSEPALEPGAHVAGPALVDKEGNVIVQGGVGQSHIDLMNSVKDDPEKYAQAVEALANDTDDPATNGHAFMVEDQNGDQIAVRDRNLAGRYAKAAGQVPEDFTGPLHSEHLRDHLVTQRAEEAKMEAEHRAETLQSVKEDQARRGPELLDAIKQLGGLKARGSKFAGEIESLKESWNKGELPRINKSGKPDARTNAAKEFNKFFSESGLDEDALVQGLQERGYDIRDIDHLLETLDQRMRDGKEIYPTKDTSAEVFGFGPGAAAQGEFDQAGRKPFRIANADIDAERQARGAEPLFVEARKENPVLWDEAMSRLDRTPQAAKILVDNINEGNVKATTDVEQAMLLHEELTLRNEKAMEADRAVDPHSTEEERAEARAKFSALEARIDATERAARKSGTEAGRALRARQLAAYDDFTLAAIETRARNAKGGPLSAEESAKIKEQATEIERLKGELAKAQDQGARDQAMEVLSNLIRENVKEAKAGLKAGKTIVDILDKQAEAAKQRIIARRGRLQVTVDPLNVAGLVDEAIIGASHIAHGIRDLTEWSKVMLADFGDRIKPYLEQLFARSQEYHDSTSKLAAKAKPKQTAVEKVAEAAKAAKAGAEEGGQLTNRMVFELAREHVQAGLTDLDEVMKAVHADLEPYFPGLTERETRDMFSDYGKVRFPSKAQDLKTLRDLRRQGQLVSALEDAQQGMSPKKTGLQRDVPSDKVKSLQKQVQDAMRESGITTATDPTRLKTNLDRYKTSLDNRITEAERRLKENDYAKPTRRATVLDKDAEAKKAALNQLQRKIDQQIERLRLKNRTNAEKLQDAAVKWARIAKLASPKILPKLVEAGLIRIVTNPMTRVLSQPVRLIPGLADKAPAQLRIDFRAEAHRISAILASGPEAIRKLVGKSSLDALGKKKLLDSEMANLVGNAHGAIKEPVRQGEYHAAIDYYTQQALRDGLDIREPAVQTIIISKAVTDANWQIFMGDNPFSKYFVSMVVQGLRNGKFTGARTLANTVQFLMPIVKVSSNIAIHTSRLGIGIPESLIRLATAAKRGELANRAELLSHEDAQAIARSFGTGALGLLLASYAWNNPDAFGGAYDEKAPKNKTGLKPNEIRIFGHVMPGWMNHAPEMQWLNVVASSRRVYDRYYAKTGPANAAYEAMAFALFAPVKNLPFIDAWLRLFSGRQTAGQTAGQLTRDAIFPGGKSVMGMFDKEDRAPQTGLDEIKMAIPGLRQTIPTKEERKAETKKPRQGRQPFSIKGMGRKKKKSE